jgi:hypothetical protein
LQITIRTSKFGPTLVILSTEANGGYILGFRVNPLQQLHIIHKEISILRSEFEKFPIFGVEYTFEHQVICNYHRFLLLLFYLLFIFLLLQIVVILISSYFFLFEDPIYKQSIYKQKFVK